MDVLIMPTGFQVTVEGIGVQFHCGGVHPTKGVIDFNFAVNYAYGATLSVKRTAIQQAAIAAYETIYGEPAPTSGVRLEILGL